MMNDFKVSVIIPAYNASKFIRKAVEAAACQDEVGEIVIVEDRSPDDTYKVCLQLEKEFDKVKLYRHPDEQNHGCGASRNLGLKYSSFPYVTFADADNYLLPGRYKLDKSIFENSQDVDGVYHAEGIHYYDKKSEIKFKNTVNLELLTFTHRIPAEEVFNVLIGDHPKVKGSWGIDSLTIKKELFVKTGNFNTKLKLQQDVDLFIKMTAIGKFVGGDIEKPQSIRGVHEEMRSTNIQLQNEYRIERWRSLNFWFRKNEYVPIDKKKLFVQKYREFKVSTSPKIKASIVFLGLIVRKPSMIRHSYEYFDQTIFSLYGKNWFTLHIISFKNKLFKNKIKSK